jgi:hypothetical protein
MKQSTSFGSERFSASVSGAEHWHPPFPVLDPRHNYMERMLLAVVTDCRPRRILHCEHESIFTGANTLIRHENRYYGKICDQVVMFLLYEAN